MVTPFLLRVLEMERIVTERSGRPLSAEESASLQAQFLLHVDSSARELPQFLAQYKRAAEP